ncbi:MAG: bifunctional sugar-1-phosphate nucleotidylyltransferase/acetyltransferase [Nanoarchaeota archaeon]
MQCVILAAGKSTRTFPLTLAKPKVLLKVAGKTIIEHTLSELQDIVTEAIIIVGYKDNMIRDFVGKKFGKIRIRYLYQKTQDGNGNALLLAKDFLKERFLVLLGDDIYCGKDIKKCTKHKYCLLVQETEDLSRFGQVIIKNKGVDELKEKPGLRKGYANCGIMVLDNFIFRHKLIKSERGEFEITDFINYLVESKQTVAVEEATSWVPITYPWSLLDANEMLLKDIKPKIEGEIEKGATVKGNIKLGKGSILKSGAYIEGNVIIGKNCSIGPNCYIRGCSTIGDNCKIGNAVEVKNSIIGDNCSVGHLSYIGDSVLGDNVNIAAGTITANLRHDDSNVHSFVKNDLVDSTRRKLGAIIADGVHTGINTSIYPGRKIWPDKSTLPGEIVRKDIE